MKTEVTYRSTGVNWNNWRRKEGRSHSSQGITSKARQRFNRFFFCHLRYVFSYLTFQVSTVVLLVFVQHWLKISRTQPFKTFQRVFLCMIYKFLQIHIIFLPQKTLSKDGLQEEYGCVLYWFLHRYDSTANHRGRYEKKSTTLWLRPSTKPFLFRIGFICTRIWWYFHIKVYLALKIRH